MRSAYILLAGGGAMSVAAAGGGLLAGAPGLLAGAVVGLGAALALALWAFRRRVLPALEERETAFQIETLRSWERARRVEAVHPRAPWLRLVPPELSVSLPDVLARVSRLARRDPASALAETETLLRRHPRSASVHRLRAEVLLKLQRRPEALEAAADAIRLGLRGGPVPEALRAYRAFQFWREGLQLDGTSVAALGRVLARQGDAEGAAWCAARVPLQRPAEAP